jgi:hypothetical protein
MLPKVNLVLVRDLLRLEHPVQSQALLFRESRARRLRDTAVKLFTVAHLDSVAHFSGVTVRLGDMRVIRSAHDGRKTLG